MQEISAYDILCYRTRICREGMISQSDEIVVYRNYLFSFHSWAQCRPIFSSPASRVRGAPGFSLRRCHVVALLDLALSFLEPQDKIIARFNQSKSIPLSIYDSSFFMRFINSIQKTSKEGRSEQVALEYLICFTILGVRK